MRYTAADWSIIEVRYAGKQPSQTYAEEADNVELVAILAALRQLAAAGVPPDREKGNPRIQKWAKYKPKGRKTAYHIYVLKTTPHRWRLYFYVPNAAHRQIEILYAVSKKQDKRNPADLDRCKFLLDRIVEGSAECRTVRIGPPR